MPGLAAKPIIDLMIGVESLVDAEMCITPLERLGYNYVPEFEEETPQRRYFRKTTPDIHTHHLHVVETASDWWDRHLLFRDYLRNHSGVAQQYEDLKHELAEEHRYDIRRYTDAKAEFITEIEERARNTASDD